MNSWSAIAAVLGGIAALVLWILGQWYSQDAQKKNILRKMRENRRAIKKAIDGGDYKRLADLAGERKLLAEELAALHPS